MPRILVPVFAIVLAAGAADAAGQTTVRQTYQQEGWNALRAARYADAEQLFRAAIKEAESAGAQDALYGHHLRGLGIVLNNMGRPAEAEPYLRRALAISEKTEPDTNNHALSLEDIGDIEFTKANYAEALRIYQRCVAIIERQPAPDQGVLASALGSIGRVHAAQSRFDQAEPFLKRALAAREADPDKTAGQVAYHVSQLGTLYYNLGRNDEAEPYFRRALAMREQAYGSDHPEVAASLHSLALLANARGNITEAEALYRRALAIGEKVYGADNVQLTGTLNNLANIHQRLGRFAEAEALHRRSLAIREKTYGTEHPNVALALANLADIHQILGRYADARPLLDRALAIREKSGPETTLTAASLESLSWWHLEQQQFAQAEPLARRAMAIREKVFGPTHRFVSSAVRNLALSRFGQGAQAETVSLLQRANAIDRAAPRDGNRDEANAALQSGDAHAAAGRVREAQHQYLRALGLHIAALGPDDTATARCLEKVAAIFERQEKKTLAAFYRLRAATR